MPYRVLIVDDSPVMRGFIRRVMTLAGVEISACFEASNGQEALAHLRRENIDCVLTDINMPQMNGDELLREMKREGMLPRIPTLIVSTDATEQRIHQMIAMGAQGYVTKPFSPEMLRQQLELVLGEMNAN
jgi:two-component system chemotaxis response regulator CheY